MAEPKELTPDEDAELDRLCEEYSHATRAARKALHVGNPVDLACVGRFLEADERVSMIVARIKQILGVAGT